MRHYLTAILFLFSIPLIWHLLLPFNFHWLTQEQLQTLFSTTIVTFLMKCLEYIARKLARDD